MSSTILEEVLQTLNSSPTVSEAFQAASTAVSNAVGQDITDAWALGGAELYTTGSTSWEATLEYFKASPVLAETLGPAPFLSWTKFGTEIGRDSVLVATSFFRASPSMAPALDQEVLAKWVNLGVSIYKYPGAPELLACRFFEASPRLTRDSRYIDTAVLVQILTRVSKWSNDLAVEVLSLSSRLFQVMDDDALQSLLSTASLISEENISCVRPLLDVGLGTYLGMQPEHRPHLLGAISVVDSASPDNLITYLGHVSRFQSSFKGDAGAIVSRFSGLLAKSSITAAREFMKNIPNIIERLDPPMVELWCKEGMSLLKAHEAAGVNFFRFESKEAMDLLYSLTPAVDLQEVRDVLRLYCQALMGKSIAILPAEDITSKGASWSLVEQIPYDGAAIFAPSRMQEFDSKDMNFESYKVLATHQAAHQEFYTYGFSFSKEGAVFQNLRESLERELRQDRSHAVDFERFFSLFPSRNLAKDLFTVAEDARIDHKVSREYRGIRRALQNALDHAVLHRPTPESLNLREAMVEVLLQITLGRSGPFVIPQDHLSILERSSVLLKTMYRDDATVEDAAEAALRIYQLIQEIPNSPYADVPPDQKTSFTPNGESYNSEHEDAESIIYALSHYIGANPEDLVDGDEEEYHSMPSLPHRGDINPEMIQTLLRLQKDVQLKMTQLQNGANPEATQDMIQKLLDSMIESYDLEDYGDYAQQSEALNFPDLMASLMRILKGQENTPAESALAASLGENDLELFKYDEWDYRAKSYRPKWCQIKQRTLKEGEGGFYQETLNSYQWLVSNIRRQFEMLRPENFRRIKRLPDGEEFDLDAVIESVVERRAGTASSDKLYWRREKADRDVAVAVLLDMSLSTDERVEQKRSVITTAEPYEPRPKDNSKRIIDVEKESVVLLIEALEQIKDSYGVYGFSGAGKEDVQFYVIKEMNEPFSQQVKSRIDKITPVQGTRMGTAIRHTISKLEKLDAKVRVLILLSDGRPQDRDYGSSSWEVELAVANLSRLTDYYPGAAPMDMFTIDEKEYAVHDTKMALVEARNKNIIPFCISVDKEGHDYMREMCGDIGYEVVGDIESLPRRLPNLYRRLTT